MLSTDKRSLLDVIDYQQDAIVSRTLIDRDAGSVTLFALDRGQRLGEHAVPFDTLIVMLEGEAEVRVGNQDFHLRQDASQLIPANERHALRAIAPIKMLLIMIKT